jgi:hypothetical protein
MPESEAYSQVPKVCLAYARLMSHKTALVILDHVQARAKTTYHICLTMQM